MDTPPPSVTRAFAGVRLHIVSGKGGTGKTTIAAALAHALAAAGQAVLLCEVEGRASTSRLFASGPLDYSEREVWQDPGGGSVRAVAIEPRQALLDYLNSYYMLGGQAGRILDSLGAVDFATTIAPGLRDVLLTGKVYEAAKRRTNRRSDAAYVYDAVVVDAPPTGRITHFLNVSHEVAGLAKIGPIHQQADSMRAMFHAPTTRVHLVTLGEELPIAETLEGIEQLRAAGFTVGAVIANRLRPHRVSAQTRAALEADPAEAARQVAADLAGRPGVPDAPAAAKALVDLGIAAVRRADDQAAALERLTALGAPRIEVGDVPGGVDHATLPTITAALRAQGVCA